MSTTTPEELELLIQALKKNPTDLDLINKVALGYYENPEMIDDEEDWKHLEKAYSLKKTVKSTHNLAWYLYFELSDHKRAMEVQKECLELVPKSANPYNLYGYMLMGEDKYEEAISYFTTAHQIGNQRNVLHNIGFCYVHLGNFEKARACFLLASDGEKENNSLYNLAVVEWKLKRSEEAKKIADKLFTGIQNHMDDAITGYEIGGLYFLLGDLVKTAECVEKQSDDIDFLMWPELSYAFSFVNNEQWLFRMLQWKEECEDLLLDLEENTQEWEDYSKEEMQEEIAAVKSELEERKKILAEGPKLPEPNIMEFLTGEYCGCLLFGCAIHGNPEDD